MGDIVSVTVTEPRFAPGDKERLIMSRRRDHRPRGSHGLLLSESTNPANDGRFSAMPTIDFAQKALNATKKAWEEQHGDVMDTGAFLWRVEKVD